MERDVKGLTANRLRLYLFGDHRFTGARTNYYALQNSDLNYVLDTGKGNPISLCLIFQLVAIRLELGVSACNYPGNFLSRISISGSPHLVDCYNMGRLTSVDALLKEGKNLSEKVKYVILTESSPRVILHRVLRNMEQAFLKKNEMEDAISVSYTHLTLPTICSV